MLGALDPQQPGMQRKAVASMLMNQFTQRMKMKKSLGHMNGIAGSRSSSGGAPFRPGRMGQHNQFILPFNRGLTRSAQLADNYGGNIRSPQMVDWFNYTGSPSAPDTGTQIPLQQIPDPAMGTVVPQMGTGNVFTGGVPGGTITGDPENNAYVTGKSDVNPFQISNPILNPYPYVGFGGR